MLAVDLRYIYEHMALLGGRLAREHPKEGHVTPRGIGREGTALRHALLRRQGEAHVEDRLRRLGAWLPLVCGETLYVIEAEEQSWRVLAQDVEQGADARGRPELRRER